MAAGVLKQTATATSNHQTGIKNGNREFPGKHGLPAPALESGCFIIQSIQITLARLELSRPDQAEELRPGADRQGHRQRAAVLHR